MSKTEKEVEIDVYQLHRLNLLAASPTLLGDVNLDGVVNDDDIQLILDYIAGSEDLTEQQFINADVNGDGIVNEIDIQLIVDFPYYVAPDEPDEPVEEGGLGMAADLTLTADADASFTVS